jgi:hypothetical protein
MMPPKDKKVAMGLAWYRADQWVRLLAISEDRDQLELNHEEWIRMASERFDDLRRQGQQVQKVEVDVEDLLKWCRTQGLPVNSSTRAQYAAQRLRNLSS